MNTNKFAWVFSFTLMSAVLLSACQPTSNSAGKPLQGTVWLLESYQDNQGNTAQVQPDSNVFIMITSDGQVYGNATCNRFSGSYTLNGDKLTINPGAMTLMMCPGEALIAQERDFIAAISGTTQYKISGDQLTLLAENGDVLATFKAQSATALSDSSWQAVAYNNGKDAVVSLLAETEITAEFSPEGKLNGSAGCNNYMTEYKVDGNKITISPAATTRMFCSSPEGVMEQEAAYLAALERATTFEITGNVLRLLGEDGVNLVEFRAK